MGAKLGISQGWSENNPFWLYKVIMLRGAALAGTYNRISIYQEWWIGYASQHVRLEAEALGKTSAICSD